MKINKLKYPSNWKKVTKVIRRIAGGCCEQCGQPFIDSIHHIGAPYADGKSGNARDKHDLRRENLIALCLECHDAIDQIIAKRHTDKKRRKRKREKLEGHRALGIGTGLILYSSVAGSCIVCFLAIALVVARCKPMSDLIS